LGMTISVSTASRSAATAEVACEHTT
jgi:hypothetical protein